MANTFANEIDGYYNSSTPQLIASAKHGGKIRNFRATISLASQASGDTVTLAIVPGGLCFVKGWLTATASLGSSTIALGTADSPGKYRAAATFTAVNTPTPFGLAATKADSEPLRLPETILMTIGAASLPSSGSLVIDLEFSGD